MQREERCGEGEPSRHDPSHAGTDLGTSYTAQGTLPRHYRQTPAAPTITLPGRSRAADDMPTVLEHTVVHVRPSPSYRQDSVASGDVWQLPGGTPLQEMETRMLELRQKYRYHQGNAQSTEQQLAALSADFMARRAHAKSVKEAEAQEHAAFFQSLLRQAWMQRVNAAPPPPPPPIHSSTLVGHPQCHRQQGHRHRPEPASFAHVVPEPPPNQDATVELLTIARRVHASITNLQQARSLPMEQVMSLNSVLSQALDLHARGGMAAPAPGVLRMLHEIATVLERMEGRAADERTVTGNILGEPPTGEEQQHQQQQQQRQQEGSGVEGQDGSTGGGECKMVGVAGRASGTGTGTEAGEAERGAGVTVEVVALV